MSDKAEGSAVAGTSGTSRSKIETTDFMSFDDSQNFTSFSPASTSSPRTPWKDPNKSYSQPGRYFNNQRYSGDNSNSPGCSSYTPHKRSFRRSFPKYKQRFGYKRGYNSSYASTSNASFQSDGSFSSPKHYSEKDFDVNKYLHPSFTENPWQRLEEKLFASKPSTSMEATLSET